MDDAKRLTRSPGLDSSVVVWSLILGTTPEIRIRAIFICKNLGQNTGIVFRMQKKKLPSKWEGSRKEERPQLNDSFGYSWLSENAAAHVQVSGGQRRPSSLEPGLPEFQFADTLG